MAYLSSKCPYLRRPFGRARVGRQWSCHTSKTPSRWWWWSRTQAQLASIISGLSSSQVQLPLPNALMARAMRDIVV
jgi:hypothetical protein